MTRPITHISVTACFNTLARSIYDMCNVWSVSVNIVASEVRSKNKKAKTRKRDTAENISGQKSGSSSSGPARPATMATFPTGGHKAARHIQGNMSKTNTNKEVPPWNDQLENYWREKLVSQA